MTAVRILLSAWIGSSNLGDEAIFEVVSGLISEPSGELTVLSQSVERTRRLPLPEGTRIVPDTPREFLRQLRRSDALLIGGGGIIQDETSIGTMASWAARVRVARLLGKPVAFFFVGVGPIISPISSRMLRGMARGVRLSLVRDEQSRELLVAHGFDPASITVAYDPVYSLEATDSSTDSSTDSATGNAAGAALPIGDFVVLCPRDWFYGSRIVPARIVVRRDRRNGDSPLSRFRRQLLRLVEAVLTRHPNLSIVGVPFYLDQDADLLVWIAAQLPAELRGRFTITGELTPQQYVALARSSRAVIGMRLHSLILGALSGRPLIALVYSSKVRSVVGYLGLADRATELDRPDFPIERVLGQLEQLADDTVPESSTGVDEELLTRIRQENERASTAFLAALRRLVEERRP